MATDERPQIGPTGEFPQGGPVHPGDKGGINVAIAVDRRHGVVFLVFGKAVEWLALTEPEVADLIGMLERNLAVLRGTSQGNGNGG